MPKKFAKKIVVIMGGDSAEREISLRTGTVVSQGLKEKGYEVVNFDLDENIVGNLKKEKPDCVFIALHGPKGEDGTIQGLLEILNIPYVGCGVLASALALNKTAAKKIWVHDRILTPPFLTFSKNSYRGSFKEIFGKIKKKLGVPVIVKPDNQGSSIGVTFSAKTEKEIFKAFILAAKFSENEILVEKFIFGKEITVSILGNENAKVLPIIEIIPKRKFYDYQARYTPGLSDHLIPPRLPKNQQKNAGQMALRAYKALGCHGMGRVDIIVDKNGKPYVLEINTIPGMTQTSLYPDAAKAAGISFPDLLNRLIELSLV